MFEKFILTKAQKLKGFHDIALKHAFNHQSISKDEQFAKMKFMFVGSDGKRYFRYQNEEDTPMCRFDEIQIIMQELQNRISNEDLDNFCAIILQWVNEEKRKTLKTDIANMIYAMQKRRELLYEPFLLFRMCAALYISEDQDPTIWDEEFEKKKVEVFIRDSKGGLYDFFYSAGLGQYLPSVSRSKASSSQQEVELELVSRQVEQFKELLATVQSS